MKIIQIIVISVLTVIATNVIWGMNAQPTTPLCVSPKTYEKMSTEAKAAYITSLQDWARNEVFTNKAFK